METTTEQPKFSRFSGDRGRRIFGRVRYLWESGLTNREIAERLRAEGIEVLPNGQRLTRRWVAPLVSRWTKYPYRKLRYIPVRTPLNSEATQPDTTPEVENLRYLNSVLRRQDVAAEEKIEELRRWLGALSA